MSKSRKEFDLSKNKFIEEEAIQHRSQIPFNFFCYIDAELYKKQGEYRRQGKYILAMEKQKVSSHAN